MAKEYTDEDRLAMLDSFMAEAQGGAPQTQQTPEDQFINGVVQEDNQSVLPSVQEEDARFLQNSLNMYDNTVAKKQGTVPPDPLLVDGVIGPKSKARVKEIYSSLPPHFRRAIQKQMGKDKA